MINKLEDQKEHILAFYHEAYPKWFMETVVDDNTIVLFVALSGQVLLKLLNGTQDETYQFPLTSDNDVFMKSEVPGLNDGWRNLIRKIYISTDAPRPMPSLANPDEDWRPGFEKIIDETFPSYSKLSHLMTREERDRFYLEFNPYKMNPSVMDTSCSDVICYCNFKTNQQRVDFFKRFGQECDDRWDLGGVDLFLDSIDYNESDFYRQFADDHEGLLTAI